MLDDAAGLDEALLDDAFSDSLEQEEASDVLKPPRLGEHPSASEFRLDLDEVDEEEGEGGSRRPDTDRGNGASGEAHEGAERGRHPGADDQRPRRRAHAPERGRLEDTCVPELLWGVYRSHGTARIRLERGEVVKDLWIVRGHPRFATSNQPADRLIELLGRRSLIPLEKLETARTLVGRDERRAAVR